MVLDPDLDEIYTKRKKMISNVLNDTPRQAWSTQAISGKVIGQNAFFH